MANKKKKEENSLQYLQMPLPSGAKFQKMAKVAFGGLNKRYEHDSGEMTMEKNISASEFPYLVPSQSFELISDKYSKSGRIPISMAAFDDFMFVIYREDKEDEDEDGKIHTYTHIKLDYITKKNYIYTGLIKKEKTLDYDESEDKIPRSIVQFNVYIESEDIVNGEYEKRYLIFPDKVSLHTNFVTVDDGLSTWTEEYKKKASRSALYYNERTNVYFNIKEDEKGNLSEKLHSNKGYFLLDGMAVEVNSYRNTKASVDKSGAIIYPPPDTASHNGWYQNTHTKDIYRWCEYKAARTKDGEEIAITDDGAYKTSDGNGNTFNVSGFELDGGNLIFDGDKTEGWKVSFPPTMPDIKYATVHLSRLFGVSDDCIYASGFNDYTNWNLDTIDEYYESNAWQSKAQSNTKADGVFTGITNYQGHVICFKRDFMHELYNTKNPFRIQDIYAEGAIDHRTLQDVDGKLIFVSEDDVKVYTGSNPRIIGYNLNMPRYDYAVSGTDNRNYYLYCESGKTNDMHLYVYDTYTELWSEQEIDSEVLNFAHNKNGMYMLCADGNVYKLDSGYYDVHWGFETDLITSKTVDIKHIKKIQMLVEHSSSANMQVYILYDDEMYDKMSPEEREKRLVYDTRSKSRYGKYPIRVKPRKTANYGFKLHIEGYEYVRLYELEIFIEAGGDMYV